MAADPATIAKWSLLTSVLSVLVTAGNLAWLHFIKVDSVICTLVACELRDLRAVFQFSFSNLGNRSALLRDVRVRVFVEPDLTGFFMDQTKILEGKLPKVVEPGDLCSVTVESPFDLDFLKQTSKQDEPEHQRKATFYFVVTATLWNPKGRRMMGRRQVATLSYDLDMRGSDFHPIPDRSFRIGRLSLRRRLGRFTKTLDSL